MSTTPGQTQNRKIGSLLQNLTPAEQQAFNVIFRQSLGILAGIAGMALLGMYWEPIWELLLEGVPLVLEVAEEALDTFFEKVVRLSPYLSQMATAYFGFVSALVFLYFFIRQSIRLWKRGNTAWLAWKKTYVSAWDELWNIEKNRALKWWQTLDLFHQIAISIGLFLIGIPVALLISFMLGSLVAVFL
jgi:hypothetical protein